MLVVNTTSPVVRLLSSAPKPRPCRTAPFSRTSRAGKRLFVDSLPLVLSFSRFISPIIIPRNNPLLFPCHKNPRPDLLPQKEGPHKLREPSKNKWSSCLCYAKRCLWRSQRVEFITTEQHGTPGEVADEAVAEEWQTHRVGLQEPIQRVWIERTIAEEPNCRVRYKEEHRRASKQNTDPSKQ